MSKGNESDVANIDNNIDEFRYVAQEMQSQLFYEHISYHRLYVTNLLYRGQVLIKHLSCIGTYISKSFIILLLSMEKFEDET